MWGSIPNLKEEAIANIKRGEVFQNPKFWGSGISKGIIFQEERPGGLTNFVSFLEQDNAAFIVTWQGVLQTSQQDLAITLLHHHPCGLYPKTINRMMSVPSIQDFSAR